MKVTYKTIEWSDIHENHCECTKTIEYPDNYKTEIDGRYIKILSSDGIKKLTITVYNLISIERK